MLFCLGTVLSNDFVVKEAMKHSKLCKKQAETIFASMASLGGDFNVLDEADIDFMAMALDDSKYRHKHCKGTYKMLVIE